MIGYALGNAVAEKFLKWHRHSGTDLADCSRMCCGGVHVDFAADAVTHKFTYAHAPVDPATAMWWSGGSNTGWRVAAGELQTHHEGYFRPDLSMAQLEYLLSLLARMYRVQYTPEWARAAFIVHLSDGEMVVTVEEKLEEIVNGAGVILQAVHDYFEVKCAQ